MNRTAFFMAACFILSMSACTKTSENTNSAGESPEVFQDDEKPDTEETQKESQEDPNTIYLEGLYATSIQLPHPTYAIENIFVNDKKSFWQTMKGAGPDEGFMLYFKEEVFIEDIQLTEADGPDMAHIKSVAIYTNGSSHGTFSIDKPIGIGKKLKSLYIRIKELDNIDNKTRANNPALAIEVFDEKLSAGFSIMSVRGENGNIYKIVPPQAVAGTVEASSILPPQIAYHPSQLFDSRKEFVWAEGASGAGENETLTFKFEENVKMDALKLWNGFQRSDKHYTANARVKSFEFGTPGNTSVYQVKDEQTPQEIKLKEALEGKEFLFKILEVYSGASYKDAVISEMRFINKDRSFVIRNSEREKNIESLQTKVRGKMLEAVLDRRIKNTMEDYGSSENSLILRSDYTFVLYENDQSDNDSREIIGDGSWEIVESGDETARIRVFGKLLDLSKTYDEYKGASSASYLRIFQDFVHIDEATVKGEKFVRSFEH